jgi:putative intracellular protease/amidase
MGLQGKRVAILAENLYQEMELWVPYYRLREEGADVKVVGAGGAIKDDLIHAGARWVDQEVVVDGHLITSRKPQDLPAFCRELVQALAKV